MRISSLLLLKALLQLKSCLFIMALVCPSATPGAQQASTQDQRRDDSLAVDTTNTHLFPLPFHTSSVWILPYPWRESWDLTPVSVWWNKREAAFVKGVTKLLLLVGTFWSIILTLLIGKLVWDLHYIIKEKKITLEEKRDTCKHVLSCLPQCSEKGFIKAERSLSPHLSVWLPPSLT